MTVSSSPSPTAPEQSKTGREVWIASLLSGLLLAAAFPPVGCWPLAWIAPAGWCWLVSRETLPGRRPYRVLWLTGLIHWMLVLHFVRLPHWSAGFGWPVISGYLALYIPIFVGLSRIAVHRWQCPLWMACPIVWAGVEFTRSYIFTGFALAPLSHTQYYRPVMIQIANLGGGYLVSALIVLVAASLTSLILARKLARKNGNWRLALTGCGMAAVCVAATAVYGWQQINASIEMDDDAIQIALIQGSRDTTFTAADDPRVTLDEYRTLTRKTLAANPSVDLIVWPESMHTAPWCEMRAPVATPDDFPDDQNFEEYAQYLKDRGRFESRWFATNFRRPALVGCGRYEMDDQPMRRYNSAMWVDENGEVSGFYDKVHPVMFGEYIPLGNVFPWLYRLTPMGSGLNQGTGPMAISVKDIQLSPSICFENTVPHLIRRQVRQLTESGTAPDALVTITNDGWFWGSSQLDIHLACGIFRAVELGRPTLIAANTGFSAWIDSHGQVIERGPRRATGAVIATVGKHKGGQSLYLKFGDWWAGLCVACCVMLAVSTRLGR